MIKVFAFEQYSGAAAMGTEPLGVINRRWPPDIVPEVVIQSRHELLITAPPLVGVLQFLQRVHQCFGNETTTKWAKVA